MRILALDTSSLYGALGLSIDGELFAEMAVRSQETHSARLLPAVDELLRLAGLTVDDIDGWGVTAGPGSFTGLRVGLATVKGLAWGKNKPVAALSSLEILARGAAASGICICPMLDARKQRVYSAVYTWQNGDLRTLVEPSDTDVAALVQRIPGDFVCLGGGARKYEERIRETAGERARFAPPWCDIPRGAVAVRMAEEALRAGRTTDIAELEPVYLRLSEAEAKETEKNS